MKVKELIRLLEGITDPELTVFVYAGTADEQINVSELEAMHMGALIQSQSKVGTHCIQEKNDPEKANANGIILIPGYYQPQQTEFRFFGLKPNWGE